MRIAVLTSLLLLAGCYQAVDEILDTTGGTGGSITATGTSGGSSDNSTASTGTSTAAASSGTVTGTVTTTGGHASSVGASSGNSTATATGTSSSTASSSTSGNPNCILTDCSASQVEIRGSLTALCEGGSTAVSGATLTDLSNPSLTATSDSTGNFDFCVPPGTQLAVSAQASGYEPTIFATIDAEQSACIGEVPLVCTAVASFLPDLLPGFDSSLAVLLVATTPESATGTCSTVSGWSYAISDTAGGLDAGAAAVSGSGVSLGDVTGTTGLLLYYNIDPAVGPITSVQGTQATIGSQCPYVGNQPPAQLTGGVNLAASSVSYFPYVIP